MSIAQRILVTIASVSVGLCAWVDAVRAERCDIPEVPWVLIEFAGEDWLEALAPEILADLRPHMHRRGIAVCGPDDIQAGAPSARVKVQADRDNVSIVLRGLGAPEGIGRTVTFRMPADSRALEVARNLQEALRVTWEELNQVLELPPLDDQGRVLPESARTGGVPVSSTAATAPPADTAAIGAAPAPTPWGAIEAIGLTVFYPTGLSELGGGVRVQLWPRARFGAELGIDATRALSETFATRTLHASGVAASADARMTFSTSIATVAWHVLAGMRLSHRRFEGMQVGRETVVTTGTGLVVRTGVRLSWRILDRLGVSMEARLGAPVIAVLAVDEAGDVLSGARDLELSAGLSLGWSL